MIFALVAPDEHTVLVFLCEIVVILAVAKALGWLLGRVGQPAVVGELLGGLILGPSVLGRVAPDVFDWLFPDDVAQGAMLYGLAWLGLILLLAATGFESDLGVLRSLGRPAVLVSLGSLIVPLVGGFALGLAIPEALRGENATTATFAAFMAVALSISSLPVVAKVLAELGLVRRNVGQLILAAATANDVVGWILLGLVAGLAEAGEVRGGDLVARAAGVVAFLAGSLWLGQKLVDRTLRAVSSSSTPVASPALVMIGVVIGAAALTQWMGVEAVLGAFVAGLVIGRSRWRDERAIRLVETLGTSILAPLFFATAGLRVDLAVFGQATVAWWSVVVVLVASATKFIGAIGGARAGGLPPREQVALGVALNARGALEIVIASVGLSIGVLNDESYGVIVVMAIVTSLAAPPLLRRGLRDWPGTPEEQRRLRAEEASRRRLVVSNRPPLLLTRGQPPSILAAQLLDFCWPTDIPVSLWSSMDPDDLAPVTNCLEGRRIRFINRPVDEAISAAAVLAEADRGHGAIVLGLVDRPSGPALSPLAEQIVAGATTPVILVRGERISGRRLPSAFARAMVPVTGSVTSRAALELAIGVSTRLGTALLLTHLDPTPQVAVPFLTGSENSPLGLADPLLRDAAQSAHDAGVASIATLARGSESVPAELVSITVEADIDLLVLGAARRDTGEGTFLGPIATHALTVCPCTVAVVVTPPGWAGWHQL